MTYADYVASSYILSQNNFTPHKNHQYKWGEHHMYCSNTKIILVVLDFIGNLISITCTLDWVRYTDGVSYTWKGLVLRLPR